jgi:hypothetical protein
MSAAVTAAMAAIRAAPSDFKNSTKPCTSFAPKVIPPGKNCLVDGYCRVNAECECWIREALWPRRGHEIQGDAPAPGLLRDAISS